MRRVARYAAQIRLGLRVFSAANDETNALRHSDRSEITRKVFVFYPVRIPTHLCFVIFPDVARIGQSSCSLNGALCIPRPGLLLT